MQESKQSSLDKQTLLDAVLRAEDACLYVHVIQSRQLSTSSSLDPYISLQVCLLSS